MLDKFRHAFTSILFQQGMKATVEKNESIRYPEEGMNDAVDNPVRFALCVMTQRDFLPCFSLAVTHFPPPLERSVRLESQAILL